MTNKNKSMRQLKNVECPEGLCFSLLELSQFHQNIDLCAYSLYILIKINSKKGFITLFDIAYYFMSGGTWYYVFDFADCVFESNDIEMSPKLKKFFSFARNHEFFDKYSDCYYDKGHKKLLKMFVAFLNDCYEHYSKPKRKVTAVKKAKSRVSKASKTPKKTKTQKSLKTIAVA